jgi:hypothetical protein
MCLKHSDPIAIVVAVDSWLQWLSMATSLGVAAASVVLGSCTVQHVCRIPHGLGLDCPEMSELTYWVAVMSLRLWGRYLRSFPGPFMLLGLRKACQSRLSRR